MSTRSRALHKYISQDGFAFPDGPMAHRLALKHVHASWAKHLEQYNTADVKVAQLFQAMHDHRHKYASDPEGFWQAVKEQVPWALFLSLSDISDIAEAMVLARRDYVDKVEDEGSSVKSPKKKLPKLVHSWIQWHDNFRRESKSVSTALSFVPSRFVPSRRVSMSSQFSSPESSDGEEDSDDDPITPTVKKSMDPPKKSMDPPKRPMERKCDLPVHKGQLQQKKASGIVDGTAQTKVVDSSAAALVSDPRRSRTYSPARQTRSKSHVSITETGPLLASSARIAKLITQTTDDILKSTGSLTDPETHLNRMITDPFKQSMHRIATRKPRASQNYLSGPVYKNRNPQPSRATQVAPARVQKTVAASHTPKAITRNAAKILAAAQTPSDTVPIPSGETSRNSSIPVISELNVGKEWKANLLLTAPRDDKPILDPAPFQSHEQLVMASPAPFSAAELVQLAKSHGNDCKPRKVGPCVSTAKVDELEMRAFKQEVDLRINSILSDLRRDNEVLLQDPPAMIIRYGEARRDIKKWYDQWNDAHAREYKAHHKASEYLWRLFGEVQRGVIQGQVLQEEVNKLVAQEQALEDLASEKQALEERLRQINLERAEIQDRKRSSTARGASGYFPSNSCVDASSQVVNTGSAGAWNPMTNDSGASGYFPSNSCVATPSQVVDDGFDSPPPGFGDDIDLDSFF
ncbi:hypothetical protein SCARD494_11614 [Seiridium cardinale]